MVPFISTGMRFKATSGSEDEVWESENIEYAREDESVR